MNLDVLQLPQDSCIQAILITSCTRIHMATVIHQVMTQAKYYGNNYSEKLIISIIFNKYQHLHAINRHWSLSTAKYVLPPTVILGVFLETLDHFLHNLQ